MRTTLALDDDVLRAARSLALARSISLGAAVSDLARMGLRHRQSLGEENGIPVFRMSPDAPPITLEDVKQIEDEL